MLKRADKIGKHKDTQEQLKSYKLQVEGNQLTMPEISQIV